MYTVSLLLGKSLIAEAKFKGITRVAKFIDTCDFDIVEVIVTTPKGKLLYGEDIKEIWNA